MGIWDKLKKNKESRNTEKLKNSKKNFKYLDKLIHLGPKKVDLDSSVTIGDMEIRFIQGIKVDVDDLVIDGHGYTIDSRDKAPIFNRTGKKFGISVTGIMGVNCLSHMEFYERNNSFTTILTLIMYRILNMENTDAKEILKKIIVHPTLDRQYIGIELSKDIKSEVDRLEEIKKEQSKKRKNQKTTFNKIKKICNSTNKNKFQKNFYNSKNNINVSVKNSTDTINFI